MAYRLLLGGFHPDPIAVRINHQDDSLACTKSFAVRGTYLGTMGSFKQAKIIAAFPSRRHRDILGCSRREGMVKSLSQKHTTAFRKA
jgi:hypothetical protein